ncbi:MAG: GspE/PulE family protein, partial [Alphaproteobacteria bacterium]|nr:GspE/PulE family protein [Alphaproteobacteria bacterium]
DDDGYVEYATTDPFDVVRRDWVARCERRDSARPVLVLPSVFRDAMKRLRRELNDEDDGEIGVAVEIDWDQAQRMRENLEGQDVPAIVDFILFRAHALGASDIHVEPTEQSLLIRNRVDGILHEEAVLPAALHPEVSSRIKILSGMDVAEKRRPQDGRISINIRQSPIDVRVSSFPTVYGEKLVMRLLDQSSLMPSPNHLGLEPRGLRMLIDGLNAPHGLIMLCGPTGSGKTTTLYSCLGAIDKTSKNVLTVEDPVEYRLEGVHQMQVNHKIGLTFQQGLRNILRQDPDIIMVGECRDVETAEMAIQASLTGHIVFSTIHTNDAVGVVSRLLDMNIDPFLVATAMTLAIAQRLVRTICPECKAQVDGSHIVEKLRTDGVSDAKLKMLGIEIDPDLQYAVGRGRGCNYCRGTGYSGRQAVFEVFEMTNDARQIVMAEQYNADELRDLAERDGLNTLVQSGLELVEQGVTTHEEVIRVLGESS